MSILLQLFFRSLKKHGELFLQQPVQVHGLPCCQAEAEPIRKQLEPMPVLALNSAMRLMKPPLRYGPEQPHSPDISASCLADCNTFFANCEAPWTEQDWNTSVPAASILYLTR